MKKFKLLSIVLILVLAFNISLPAAALDDPTIVAAAAVLIDPDTGRVYYSLNADTQRAPASLTKVMTVLLAVEALERGEVYESDIVTVTASSLEGMIEDGSSAGLIEGESLTFIDLIYCAMLGSANDACNVIAEHVSGSVSAFVEDMNARAAELGCVNTNFTNTHGLPDDNHYTTANDLALISREAVQHELFATVCNTASYTVPTTELSGERELSNTNALINSNSVYGSSYYYEYAHGVKTGHTNAAGYCLISTAERDGIRLMAVVMGSTGDDTGIHSFTDSTTLYNWVYDNFSSQEIVSSSELVAEVAVEMGDGVDRVSLRPNTVVTAVVANDADLSAIEREIIIYSERDGETLTAPITAGTVLGEIHLLLDGQLLGSSSLVASTSVDLSRATYIKNQISETFSHTWVRVVIIVLVVLLILYILLVVRYRVLHKRHVKEQRRRRAERERQAAAVRSQKNTDNPKRASNGMNNIQSNSNQKQAKNAPVSPSKTPIQGTSVSTPKSHQNATSGAPKPGTKASPNVLSSAPDSGTNKARPASQPAASNARPASQSAASNARQTSSSAPDNARRASDSTPKTVRNAANTANKSGTNNARSGGKSAPNVDFFTQNEVDERRTVHIRSSLPNQSADTQRDYFEEFFRQQHDKEKANRDAEKE